MVRGRAVPTGTGEPLPSRSTGHSVWHELVLRAFAGCAGARLLLVTLALGGSAYASGCHDLTVLAAAFVGIVALGIFGKTASRRVTATAILAITLFSALDDAVATFLVGGLEADVEVGGSKAADVWDMVAYRVDGTGTEIFGI